MTLVEVLLLALALSADAFSVALAVGLRHSSRRQVFRLSWHFGLFQALMPVLGWLAGVAVRDYIAVLDHWVAFGLLAFVGGKMLWEARREPEDSRPAGDSTRGWALVLLSVATSIDALAVGLSLAMVGSTIIMPAMVIGVVAAAFTAVGMVLGRRIGSLWGKRVEVLGGLILIGIGVKIVVEHTWG